ncbi:serine/threonine-protein kinase [Stygiolobus caldivivus]|uniref:Protein kinase domain-containing protein n=1 Tax=Stygiolobus caldivivus TaxID=2824673 RepID=A0A8D5U5F2_9CREN|nr:serine/threonine-protein kinase [Stygiolobus caldivivus]BCU69821.1 hypothetical protein KN1_11180 [Stygiolobus caldivivus]
MTKTWKTALSTSLLLIFYFIYLVDFGGLNLAHISSAGLTTSGWLALLSLSLALAAIYLPKKANSPLAVITPLLGSCAIDFYLSSGVPIGLFLLLYAVVPFIASGVGELVGAGVFVSFIYALASANYPGYWVPFLLLIPIAVAYWSAKDELMRQKDIDTVDLIALIILLLFPFPLIAFNTGSPLGILMYLSAMALVFAGIVMKLRGKKSAWPFVASAILTYFAPIVLYSQLACSVNYAATFINAYDLFFYGSLALVFYLPALLIRPYTSLALLFTPILLGITAALLTYFNTTFYFAAIDPWLVVMTTLPKSPAVEDFFFPWSPPVLYSVQTQVPAQPQYLAQQQYLRPAQVQQFSPQVRFILKGLPPMVRAVIAVGNVTCDGDALIDCNGYGNWSAFPVKVGQYVYYPNPGSGYANPGDVITVYYVPSALPYQVQPPAQPPQTYTYAPSRPLGKVSITSFDPNALLNRRLGVYKVKSIIGSGGFGYVYLGELGGDYYAIKVLKVDKGDPVAYFQGLFHEANNLVDLSNHPNIVKIYAVNVDLNVIDRALSGDFSPYYADPPRIVMEYMGGGSLEKYLNNDMFFYSMNWEVAVRKAVRQVAEALAHIHGRGYVHSDVKPQNVFLTGEPKYPSELPSVDFKLGDLGSATRFGKDISQVTLEYSPPEVFTSKASPLMDVFALGMTLYVLLTRKVDRPDFQVMNEAFDCYVNKDVNCIKDKVEEAKRLLASWDPQVSEPYKSLIKAMVEPDPAKRPTALEVANRLR